MYDILTALYYDELSNLQGKQPMEPPFNEAERRIWHRLRLMEPEAAEEFRREIRALAIEQRNAAFRTGVRLGAQLIIQLLEDF